MKTMLLIFLMMSSLLVFAEEENCDPTPSSVRPLVAVANAVKKTCPDKSKLLNLCSSINKLTEDNDPNSNFVYQYQRIISEAACTDLETESNNQISNKVKALWERNQADFTCKNIPNFDVNEGSVLKLAVRTKFKNFLVEAANVWKVNLNTIDKSDSRTLLDYVQKEIEVNKGTVNEADLKQYYEILRKAGAKHKSEL